MEVIDGVDRWLSTLQRKGADRLNSAVADLPLKKIKFGLLIFCLLVGGVSGYLVIDGIIAEKKVIPALHIEQPLVPKHYD